MQNISNQISNNETAEIRLLVDIFKKEGITPLLVGGNLRDSFLNLESKDIDIEVYNSNGYESLANILKEFNPIVTGKSFGVIKLTIGDEDFDISLPRTESSVGSKHTDFDIKLYNTISYKESFLRRDFTINSMGYNLITGELIDIYNGQSDLDAKLIRHINSITFQEDPLRIYRAIQFASRFKFKIANETKELIRNMIENNDLDHLPKERVFEEFNKLLLKSKKPSIGFELMREFGIIERYFPELHNIIGVPQSKEWHPEGDVWVHTMMTIDEMAKMDFKENKLIHMYSLLCHDLGKSTNTQVINDVITSRGHEEAGIIPTNNFLSRLTNDKKFLNKVSKLVELHLRPTLLYKDNSGNGAIKRLAHQLIEVGLNIEDLALVNKADSLGRTTDEALSKFTPQYDWIIEKSKHIDLNKKETALVKGKDLIELGIIPGPEFKDLLELCYKKQIDDSDLSKNDLIELYIQNQSKDFNNL